LHIARQSNAEQNLKKRQGAFLSYLQDVFETKGDGWEER
jgi:type I restriction enzyme S subunit